MEKINLSERINDKNTSNDLVTHVLLAMVVHFDIEEINYNDIEVKLTLNGKEVPFTDFLERFNEQSDKWVETEAAKLLNSKLWELSCTIERINNAVKKEAEELLPNCESDENYY